MIHLETELILAACREPGDDVDKAQNYQSRLNAEALAAHQARAVAAAGPGATWCEECGEPIGEERRKRVPDAVRCVDCQKLFERGRG